MLRWRVALKLPTAADIAAEWQRLRKKGAQLPAAAPAADAEATTARRVRAMECMFGSQAAGDAIEAADDLEEIERRRFEANFAIAEEWELDEEDSALLDRDAIEEKLGAAREEYKEALQRLKAAFPKELNDCSEDGECAHRRPCPCGRGQRGAWPWVVQAPWRGFCEQSEEMLHEFTPRGMHSCRELYEERERWKWALQWGSNVKGVPHTGPACVPGGGLWMTEGRSREQYESFRRELYCMP